MPGPAPIYGVNQRSRGYLAAQGRREMQSDDPFGTSSLAAHNAWTGYQASQAPGRNTMGNTRAGTPMNVGVGQQRGTGVWGGPDGDTWLGRYGTHQLGTGIDAGSRAIGSVNYGAIGGIQNLLNSQTNPMARRQVADQLRSMGLMPSVNGVFADQYQGPQRYDSWSVQGSGGGMFGANKGGIDDGVAGTPAMSGGAPVYADLGSAAPQTGGLGSILGGKIGGSGSSSGLGSAVDQGYLGILGRGGSPFSQADQARIVAGAQDTVNRGTQDAIEQARMDAVRRGDTSGSSLGSREDQIRARGAADSSRAAFLARTGLGTQAQQALLAALGGAGGRLRDQQELEMMLGALEAQGGLQGLNLILGGV